MKLVVNSIVVVFSMKGLNKEILVTSRTDPGWVPLYPLCSGLVIERGRSVEHWKMCLQFKANTHTHTHTQSPLPFCRGGS